MRVQKEKKMFPYYYGTYLSEEEAFQNLKCHSKEVIICLFILAVNIGSATAIEPKDSLANSLMDKSPINSSPAPNGSKPSVFVSLPQPQTTAARTVNTCAFAGAIGVICANAYWTGNPIIIGACLGLIGTLVFGRL